MFHWAKKKDDISLLGVRCAVYLRSILRLRQGMPCLYYD